MKDWIPFQEGIYRSENAFLISTDLKAVKLQEPVIEIYQGFGGKLQMKGRCMVRNALIVALLEDSDDIDLLLDLGATFKYRMPQPELNAGKVFNPDINSTMQFFPSKPWKNLTETEYDNLRSRLQILSS